MSWFVAIALVLALTSGCARPDTSAREDEVRATVTRYNRLLAEGYRTLDMSLLKDVSEQLQAEDEYIHMSALAEGGVRLLPLLTEREFLRVSVEETSALVETREHWDFKHEDRETREVLLVQEDMIYEMAWDLALHDDGRWYVRDIRALSTTTTVPPQKFATPTVEFGF